LTNNNEYEQTPNEIKHEEKESLTQKEFLDGCGGCFTLGCLPFTAVFIAFIVMLF